MKKSVANEIYIFSMLFRNGIELKNLNNECMHIWHFLKSPNRLLFPLLSFFSYAQICHIFLCVFSLPYWRTPLMAAFHWIYLFVFFHTSPSHQRHSKCIFFMFLTNSIFVCFCIHYLLFEYLWWGLILCECMCCVLCTDTVVVIHCT